MSRTKLELHQLIDRLPDAALDGTRPGRPVPFDEMVPLVKDVMLLTKKLLGAARYLAEHQVPLGDGGHGIG